MRVVIIIGILTMVSFCKKANGQIVTDRPDQTESSSVVYQGSLQLESGVLIGYEGENQEGTRQISLPTNLFRYGITRWLELRIFNQFEMLKMGDRKDEGISDMEIGTKIQLIKSENRIIEMAFLSHLIVPTGSNNLTSDVYGSSNKLCLSHEINNNVGIGYNVGYNYFGDENGDFTYSVALGIGVNGKVAIYVEPYGEIINMNDFISNFDTGFTYLVKNNLQFDFSFGTGINRTMNYLALGCSWLVQKD